MAVPAQGAAPAGTYIETAALVSGKILQTSSIESILTKLRWSCVPSRRFQAGLTEWIVQEFNPAADNAQPEGFTAVMQAVIKPVRLNNVCQILAVQSGYRIRCAWWTSSGAKTNTTAT